ncbi:hypothetical protein [Amycolatopsis albispora]|uniref:Ceramidase n=1 Tax=Amycolatopsis albispora TaxID=1804986 RepID=A0A344LE75_9PSEU|nr:hypothetical protein [Amycolatopsis albispora]AXB46349.1 hypothetical protein A4R43_31040 [Amycolatopsis albispora]
MDAYVDGYCERVAPGLWGEPLNTVSNVAFLIAAVLIWRRAQGPVARTLAVLLGLICLASTAFHALATGWAGAADTGFILVFVLYYAVAFTHLFLGVPWRRAWLAAPAFLAITVGVAALTGSMYLSALLGLFVFAALLARTPHWPRFAVAGGVFAVSLGLRTADHSVCGSFPPGTHFLWHLLNGVVLYVVSAGVVRVETPTTPAKA